MIFPPPFSQSDFDLRYLLGSTNLLRSCFVILYMSVHLSVCLSVCLLVFEFVTLIIFQYLDSFSMLGSEPEGKVLGTWIEILVFKLDLCERKQGNVPKGGIVLVLS